MAKRSGSTAPSACSRAEPWSPLPNHLVRPPQQRLRNRQAQRRGGLEIDDQLEGRRLLDGQVSRPGAAQDAVYIERQTLEPLLLERPVREQSAVLGEAARFVDGRHAMASRELDDGQPFGEEQRVSGQDQSVG